VPRMSLYSGPIASAVLPQSYTPRDTGILAQGGDDLLGAATGSILRRVFMGPQADPNAALVRQRDAETALKADELQKSQNAESARTGLSGYVDELMYRTGRSGGAGPTDRMDPVVDEQPYAGPVDFGGEKPDEVALMRTAAANRLRQALGEGADEKQTTPIMQALGLSIGDDNLTTQINASLKGTYLGDNQSPSLGAQQAKIEDEQRHSMEKADMEDKTKRYGFDTQASTSRANNADDNRTSITNNAMDNRMTARGQDMTDARARKDTEGYQTVETTTLDKGAEATPAKGKLFGLFGESKPAVAARTPSKTVKTTKVPIRAPGAAPAPAAPAKADPFPGVAQNAKVRQGGKLYQRQGDKMVEIAG
jgi:hypothetical protein